MRVCSRPPAPSTSAAWPSLLSALIAPWVPAGGAAAVMNASGWLELSCRFAATNQPHAPRRPPAVALLWLVA